MPFAPGQVINNRYRIEQLLGQGGFGAVYRAWDQTFALFCAIKENRQNSPEGERQFLREARLLRMLRHLNLPLVTDYFVLPGPEGAPGAAYLVMDYIEGDDLGQMLNRPGKSLNPEQSVAWIAQVCDALTYLHSQNPPVIHRDIKPANIKITPDGRAVLVDFGIAKFFDPENETTIGAQGVTPGFSPPEQYGSAPTDPRSDVYALGATIYCLLTGRPPLEAPRRQTGQVLPPVSSINPAVATSINRAVMRALELSPRDRWANVSEFKAALTASKAAKVTETVRIDPGTRTGISPNRWVAAGAIGVVFIAGVLILGAVLGGIFLNGNESATQTAEAATRAVTLGLEETRLAETPAARTATEAAIQLAIEQTAAAQRAAQTETAAALKVSVMPFPTELPPTRLSRDATMALIPAGEFIMGNNDGERYGMKDEGPEHPVYLDAFYIDIYEVTNAQFSEFLNDKGNIDEGGKTLYDEFDEDDTDKEKDMLIRRDGEIWKPYPGYENHPAVEMTWYGARAFCKWRGARLPTEAEWEKAARGGLKSALYPWGNEAPTCRRGTVNGAQYGPCEGDTAPIGSFGPNGFGLFDMAGNVWEFVQDWHSDDYYSISPTNNPVNDIMPQVEVRVARGGSWQKLNDETYLRTARRDSAFPYNSYGHFGFRCALDP